MKKAIIVGATSGIGRELAKLLVENGYTVGITGRRTELLQEIKQENPNRYIAQSLDVTDITDAIEKLEALATELGGMDLLVLSSGTGDANEHLDFEVEKRTIDTNVIGFTRVVDWAFNYLSPLRKVGADVL